MGRGKERARKACRISRKKEGEGGEAKTEFAAAARFVNNVVQTYRSCNILIYNTKRSPPVQPPNLKLHPPLFPRSSKLAERFSDPRNARPSSLPPLPPLRPRPPPRAWGWPARRGAPPAGADRAGGGGLEVPAGDSRGGVPREMEGLRTPHRLRRRPLLPGPLWTVPRTIAGFSQSAGPFDQRPPPLALLPPFFSAPRILSTRRLARRLLRARLFRPPSPAPR